MFYHSFFMRVKEYISAISGLDHENSLMAAIRKGKTMGLQFHPKKPKAGLELLGRLLLKLLFKC